MTDVLTSYPDMAEVVMGQVNRSLEENPHYRLMLTGRALLEKASAASPFPYVSPDLDEELRSGAIQEIFKRMAPELTWFGIFTLSIIRAFPYLNWGKDHKRKGLQEAVNAVLQLNEDARSGKREVIVYDWKGVNPNF